MKYRLLVTFLAYASMQCASSANLPQTENFDSIDVLAYAPINGDGGLRLAYHNDADGKWTPIGDYTFVSSDFGPWGSLKKMFVPELKQTSDGWALTWVADPEGYVLAKSQSADLIEWQPQTYEIGSMVRDGNILCIVSDKAVSGYRLRMAKNEVERLQDFVSKKAELKDLYDEVMVDDSARFANLSALTYKVKPRPTERKEISDMLIGIFIEDINYAADGGLYAELIQNRDFEYAKSERKDDKKWHPLTAWNFPMNDLGTYAIKTDRPIHTNNPHYLSIDAKPGFRVENLGYDGIPLYAGKSYDLTFKARGNGKVAIDLENEEGKSVARSVFEINDNGWHDYSAAFNASASVKDGRLVITALGDCDIDLDMVSLFPQDTFRGRKNGLRKDMAEALENLHPRFVRFPGGCVAHGDGVDNIYDWKGSVGPLEARKPLRNLWGYHQTRGLGYYEYFQLCEDIGAEPLPVLAAGVPCQNSGVKSHHSHDALTTKGQQCGIPMEEMGAYVQDVLDLIEWANGPADSKWGRLRAEAGHPEPFGLKYIGIGNEDMITEVFEPRFKMIYDAVRETYPGVEVVGTVGPFYEGSDYVRGWELADQWAIPYVDEHYYVSPGWLIYNQNYYDKYKRGATKVYLGEWAAHLPDRPSNIETALAEALYLTSVERNADVVAMTSYAPLFSKDNHTQWWPDLIYFNNHEVRPSIDYYVQQLYGKYAGDYYVPATTSLSSDDPKAQARVGSSIVYDKEDNAYILKIANLLPVEINAQIDMSPININDKAAWNVVEISGQPTDRYVLPVSSSVMPMMKKGVAHLTLQPYSFVVYKMQAK